MIIKSTLEEWWHGYDRADKIRIVFMVLMQMAFVGAFFLAWHEGSWLSMFVIVIALCIVWLPAVLARNLSVHVPLEFEFLLNVFIYASIFLGEISGFYTRFWWWDVVLHAGSGIALGFVGFLLLYSLYHVEKVLLPPSLLAVFSFCFALSLGALWEIFEYTIDSIMGTNMQKSGLTDTMWDLIVDAVGAGIVAVSGYFYVRYQRSGMGIFEHYVRLYFADTATHRKD